MFGRDTDKDWERFGRGEAYYAVLTHDEYRKSNLSDEAKEEFFKSGSNYIDEILDKIKKHIDHDFEIDKTIDFGCGVGRLVIPLAKYAKEIVAVDVSDSIKNCIPMAANIINLIRGRRFFSPEIQMNEYSLDRLFLSIQKTNVLKCYTEFTNHGGELGIIIYFQKPDMA